MCKKGLLHKIKHMSKYIPHGFNNIQTNKQATNIQPLKQSNQIKQEKSKQLFNQTKQQLDSKSQMLRAYAIKAKQFTEKAYENGTSNAFNSACEIKKKIEQGARSGEQIISKSKEKLVNSAKQGINLSQQVIQKKAKQIMNTTNINIKQKIIESQDSLQKMSSKIKEGVESGRQKLQNNTNEIIKTTNQYTKKLFEAAKQLVSQKNQKPPELKSSVENIQKKFLTQYNIQQKQDKSSQRKFNFYDVIWQKIQKSNDQLFKNFTIKDTKFRLLSMLTNMYWRLIFGMCLIVFTFGVSTQLPKQIRLYFSERNKLQKQQESIQRAQKQDKQDQKTGN